MRYIHKYQHFTKEFNASSPSVSIPGAACSQSRDTVTPEKVLSHKNSFSQLSRSAAMRRNIQDSIAFISEQQRAVSFIISQLESYAASFAHSKNPVECMNHYFLCAEAIRNSVKSKYRGKPIFNNYRDKPLRVHLELEGVVTPVDLPNPPVSSIIPLQSFLHGFDGETLPGAGLVSECQASLYSLLLELKPQRERLEHVLCKSKHSPDSLTGFFIRAKEKVPARTSPMAHRSFFQGIRFLKTSLSSLFRHKIA